MSKGSKRRPASVSKEEQDIRHDLAFGPELTKQDAVRCYICNGGACICCDEDEDGKEWWAAHCMNCDNTIGKPGYYDPCAHSKKEAIIRWNYLNEPSKTI